MRIYFAEYVLITLLLLALVFSRQSAPIVSTRSLLSDTLGSTSQQKFSSSRVNSLGLSDLRHCTTHV